MMSWTTVVLALLILLAAVPYVTSIRHPDRPPFTAYVLFVAVFSATAVVLFLVIGWLAHASGAAATIGSRGLALVLLVLGLLPALIVATWQARRPPRRP